MSDTFFWNVRGINDLIKHSPLSSWLYKRSVTFGALLETHVKEASKHLILAAIGSGWSLLDNYYHSDLGKIWIIYKAPTTAKVLFADLQSVTCEISLEDGSVFFYTAVYASNDDELRKDLWVSLKDTEASFGLASKPWLVNGDFNEILHPDETSNSSIVRSTRGMRLFGDCLADLGLFDLPFTGPRFTWTNKRASDPVGKKLDRCLVNGCWLLNFPTSHCAFEAPEFSDHSPCSIKLKTDAPLFGSRPFMFYNLLIKHPSFLDTVKSAWFAEGPQVSNLRDFCFKLKGLKRPMKSLLRENFSDIEKRVLEAFELLKSRQLEALNDPSPTNVQNELNARDSWSYLRLAEEGFFFQRSRVKWLGEGDFNTPYYHRMTISRNGGNAIKNLIRADGSSTSNLQEVHDLAVEHFNQILCTIKGSFCPELPEFLESIIVTKCSIVNHAALPLPFSAEDISHCLFKMPSNRTPGPDGFPAEFFKAAWSVLGPEFTQAIHWFFEKSFMPTSLNSTSLVLIAKRPGANQIHEFRPISCLNTQYKVITKLLTNRLKSLLPDLILPNQTAFVKNRLLLENVLLASEVVQGYHLSSGSAKITIKVDIAKAFDSVRWDFVLSTLQAYNIPHKFIGWVQACVCSPSFSLSINGVTSGYFKGKTGLRQGDPLSPILFVMMMNVLSLMLNKAALAGTFGFHPGCEDLQLTHLCFADDLLIFLEGSESSLEGVLAVLSEFENMSGLAVNIEKTSLFSAGLRDDVLGRIERRFGLKSASLPIRYLGLPLTSKRLSIGDCDPLLGQIKRKISSWTSRALSMAGRLTLISSVISGIIGFWSSAFILPKGVFKKVNSLCSSFLWHGTIGISSGAKVSWQDLSYPKSEGGLGLRNLQSWNDTCSLKLIWMLYFRAGSIWVAWIRSKYLATTSFWALNEKNHAYSWMFRKILKLRAKALQFIRIQVRSGDSTFFWWDPWTPFGLLYQFLGSDGPSLLGIPLFSTVGDLRRNDGWSFNQARSEKQVKLLAFLTTLTNSIGSDYPIWSIGDVIQNSFISKKVWNVIRDTKPEKVWAPLVWHKAIIHRHATTTWLFVLNRNPTLDRLVVWGLDIEPTCLLCGSDTESRNHLFFDCPYSSEVWTSVIHRLRFPSPPTNWADVFLWLASVQGDKFFKLALLQGWQGCIYEIWQERNRRFHSGLSLPPSRLSRSIISTLQYKCSAMKALGLSRGFPLALCWLDPP